MNHEMRLHKEPFEMIESGIKNIEYRLNDEKRKEIKIGDTITFYKRPEEIKTIKVVVTDLKYYPDLLSMYSATFDKDFKNRYKTPQEVVEDTPYYTEDEIKEYGCVAIYFNKIWVEIMNWIDRNIWSSGLN